MSMPRDRMSQSHGEGGEGARGRSDEHRECHQVNEPYFQFNGPTFQFNVYPFLLLIDRIRSSQTQELEAEKTVVQRNIGR